MSGPKIVRTVTRAERIEQARVQIAMIDDAIKRWRVEVASTDDDAIARERMFLSEKSRVETLLAADRFAEIAQLANSIVASVDNDIDRMRDEHYVQLARVLERKRSTRFTAKSLLVSLAASNATNSGQSVRWLPDRTPATGVVPCVVESLGI